MTELIGVERGGDRGCYNWGGGGGGSLLGRGSVFQGAVSTQEDAMETFLFKVQGIYDSVS